MCRSGFSRRLQLWSSLLLNGTDEAGNLVVRLSAQSTQDQIGRFDVERQSDGSLRIDLHGFPMELKEERMAGAILQELPRIKRTGWS